MSHAIIPPIRAPWAGRMTARERFKRQMHFQPVDRCFNMEFGYWKENFVEWDIFVQNGVRDNREADRFFSFDPIEVVGGQNWLSPAFEERIVEERGDRNVIMNRDGLLAEVPKDGAGSSIPHYLSSSIVTPDDWKRCKEERFRRDDPARRIDIDALKKLHPAERDYPLGVNTGSMIGKVRDMLTFEGLAYAVFDYPDMVEDMVETCCVMVEHSLDQLLPHFDFDYACGWEDICFKNGPIVAPDFFAAVVAPRYRRIRDRLRRYGIDLWYTDCDGDVRPLLGTFLDCGINCLFPFEVMGCAHPGELLDQYAGELRIMGGFDKMQLGKGPAAIKQYMESLVPYVERGGYIPFCDHRCPPNVKTADYLYYLDLKEAMFGLGSPSFPR
jgi:uroporphyrinogen decarboxylase